MIIVWYSLMGLFLFSALLITYQEWQKDPEKKSQQLFYLGIGVILAVGIIVRFLKVESLPGMQIDEAMAGYDAWSLANYGTDSALNSWPVYLISYGTGQSALYAYLSAPFIKIFGLSLLSIRMAMVLVSTSILLFSSWTLFRIRHSRSWRFLFILTLSVLPWHIMVSRFGLDANLAPQFLFASLCCLCLGFNTTSKYRQWGWYLTATLFLALTAYAYIASWFVLPFLVLGILWLLIKQKIMDRKQLLVFGGVLVLALIPILLFAYNQFWGQETFQILGMSIPKMPATQLDGQTVFNQNAFFEGLLKNVKAIFSFIFITHLTDGLIFNSLQGFGVFYYGMGFFFLIGFPILWKQKDPFSQLIKLWLGSSLLLLLTTKPLVHHWNLVFFPILIAMIEGMEVIFQQLSTPRKQTFLTFFAISLAAFQYTYHIVYASELRDSSYMASPDLSNILEQTRKLELDQVIVYSRSFPQLGNEFIYVRFFDPVAPEIWQATRDEPFDPQTNMTEIHYANYAFLNEEKTDLEAKKNTGYLIHKGYGVEEPSSLNYTIIESQDYYLIYYK